MIREDLGLPGGLHEPARPDAYDAVDDGSRALWTYRYTAPAIGASAAIATSTHAQLGSNGAMDLVYSPPLVVAASRGNADAIHLLLLFGEGVHPRRKGNERALYIAAEQGNVLCVAALLGRTPLRPPLHPPHIAKRLGLLRDVWSVNAALSPDGDCNGAFVYTAGVWAGPRQVAAAIAHAKLRAELASASGVATSTGSVMASASAAAALGTGALALQPGSSSIPSLDASPVLLAPTSAVEAAVAQVELLESDGRYRGWCHGYHMGTYWCTYDSSLANWEAIHGLIGNGGSGGTRPAQSLSQVTLSSLSRRLKLRVTPGSLGTLWSPGPDFDPTCGTTSPLLIPPFAVQGELVSRLAPGQTLVSASRPRRAGHVHPRLPPPIDYGALAAEVVAASVRLNIGPAEFKTPLLAAAEM